MVHEHAKQIVAGADETGKVNAQILAVLIGGALLLTAVLASQLFQQSAYSQTIAVVAALMLGIPLVYQAMKDLWTGHMHMNELAALAVVASFANEQFIEAGAIAFFMIISALIEHRTALGARKSIEALIRITPTRARRIDEEGHEIDTDAKDLRPGDKVRVLPGDNIPGDGRVLTGISTVDQANITGESLPVDKVAGDEVYGGTINVTGAMDIEITKAGHDTTLGRVKDLILQAEHTRSPISRIIDRYAHWYTPVILMFSAIVFFFTRDPNRVIGILIIACPCAFILSAPTAMVAALSAAARLGVLIKNVGTIEVARNLTAVVFDKTGTLTTGQLSVTRLNPLPGVDGAELLNVAASAERNSRHPVARAIVEVARKARLGLAESQSFEEVSGRGVRAVIGGQEVLVGRPTWVSERGVDVSGVEEAGTEGLSLLYVARGKKLLGWVGLEDKTRPDAAKAMDELRGLNMRKLVMVTGDRWSVAKRVAAEMHCTDVQAEVLPAQKLELVDELKAAGHTVAVIGDGVNDAPALAAGDISIAMGAAGSDVAINSASIALMNNNLNRIPFLVHLSRRTINVVRQNLAFAFIYTIVFMAAYTAGLLEQTVIAVLLHLASSLVVTFNSARLVREGEEVERNDPPSLLTKQRTINPEQVQPAAAMG